jgi:phosphate transport system permease protein
MSDVARLIARRKRQDLIFQVVGIGCTLVGVVTLGALLFNLAAEGLERIDWQFLTSYASRNPRTAGILAPLVGTLLVILVTAVTAVPLGVAAGVYLEEYARKNWLTSIIEINISNLAGVPSIIFGLMGLGILVYQLHLGTSILTGGLTLAFLILPIVIVATREALRAIPQGIREAAYALGSTRWQVVRHHLLPYSTGGIATGVIIALSRAIGETAP